jgi:hypothetical protein
LQKNPKKTQATISGTKKLRRNDPKNKTQGIGGEGLTGWQLLALMSAKFLRSFFGDWYLQRFLSFVSV